MDESVYWCLCMFACTVTVEHLGRSLSVFVNAHALWCIQATRNCEYCMDTMHMLGEGRSHSGVDGASQKHTSAVGVLGKAKVEIYKIIISKI